MTIILLSHAPSTTGKEVFSAPKMERAPDDVSQPSPLTMLRVSEHYATILSDEDTGELIWRDIQTAAVHVRSSIEEHARASFAKKTQTGTDALELQRLSVKLSSHVDVMLQHVNALKAHMHQGVVNATDFFSLVIDVELSHRKASEPVRMRGEPLKVDVRQQANGAATIIEDDDCPTTDLLHISLF